MEIMGLTVLPKARNISVRIVRDLPYGFILGASLFSVEQQCHLARGGQGVSAVARSSVGAVSTTQCGIETVMGPVLRNEAHN